MKQAARQNVKIIKFNLVSDILKLFGINSSSNNNNNNLINNVNINQKSSTAVDLNNDKRSVKEIRNYLNKLSNK